MDNSLILLIWHPSAPSRTIQHSCTRFHSIPHYSAPSSTNQHHLAPFRIISHHSAPLYFIQRRAAPSIAIPRYSTEEIKSRIIQELVRMLTVRELMVRLLSIRELTIRKLSFMMYQKTNPPSRAIMYPSLINKVIYQTDRITGRPLNLPAIH